VLIELLGGLGIFLLGMSLLVDGLKAVAGQALRRGLTSAVRGPGSGIAAGAIVTALVQSSSATTVATIGFVSAGILSFQQSIGVILGANLGTTSTSWLVAILGFNLSISTLALPFVALGALLHLLGRGRTSSLGLAVAGFGLLFVGLDFLEQGMGSLAADLTPGRLPAAEGWGGRVLLVLGGVVMTVLLQSSSAAIAAILAALHAGAISFEQSIAMVVGANIGTTTTAALAALSASVPARRTALAHVLFNVVTGVVATLLLGPLGRASLLLAGWCGGETAVVGVAAFHTILKSMGILLLLPWLGAFGRLVSRLVPDRPDDLARWLDSSVGAVSAVANEALRRTVVGIVAVAARAIEGAARGDGRTTTIAAELAEAGDALRKASAFAAQVGAGVQSGSEVAEHLANLHMIDHASRLLEAIQGDHRLNLVRDAASLRPQQESLLGLLGVVAAWTDPNAAAATAAGLEARSASLAELRRTYRVTLLEQTAAGKVDPEVALDELDASRLIDRIGYHLVRVAVHAARPTPPLRKTGTLEQDAVAAS